MKRVTTIPFSGFYNTLHDDALHQAVTDMFTDRASGNHVFTGLAERTDWECHWQNVMQSYAEEYAEQFAREFGVFTMRFESMQSPKYYNFTTDRIFCEVDLEELIWIRTLVPDEILAEVAAEQFTSRDGFISFYSPKVADWGDLESWDYNQLGALMIAMVRHEKGEGLDQWHEIDLMDDARMNGHLDDMICQNTPAISRYLNIYTYLNDRAERA